MNNKSIDLLLVEPCPILTKRICTLLAREKTMEFQVARIGKLDQATELMKNTHFAVVLLDLSLSNGGSAAFVEQLLAQMPSTIIILLCTEGDRTFALQAMAKGAHDCVDKKRMAHNWLRRVIGYNLMLAKAQKVMDISEARMQAIGNASSLGIMVSDLYGNIIYTNPAYQTITGFSAEQCLGQHWATSVHASDRLRLEQEWRDELQVQQTFHSEVRLSRQDNSTCRVHMTGTFIKDEKGLYGHVRAIENLTDRSSASSASHSLVKQKSSWLPATTAQLTMDKMSDAVLSTDCRGKIAYLNQAAQRMTGWSSEEAVGRLLCEVFCLKDRITGELLVDSVELALIENQGIKLDRDCLLIRKDGVEAMIEESASPIHNEQGGIIGAVLVFRDVTQSRGKSLKMIHLAQHDSLTGLANRLLLEERLDQAIRLAKRHDKLLALLYVDIDLFKKINDVHGHQVGDKLLCSVAHRMTEAVRDSDTVCRRGGDEFVLLLSEISHPNDAAKLSTKLLSSLNTPHMIEGRQIMVSISIGIAVFPNDGEVTETLMNNADSAMFHAKSSGRNCYHFYKQSMHLKARQHTLVETRIKRALLQQEFVLHYQPQFDLQSGEIIGAEALIRWQDPDLGLLYPAEFIAIAEQSPLIFLIGEWVRWQVCQQQKSWQHRGLDIVPVTVNTSAAELSQAHFFDNVQLALNDCGLDPWCMGLEVSEKDLTVSAYPLIQRLKGLGLKLVLDDFGSGTGHLSYLHYLAFDSVKIDPEIIYAAVNETDQAIIAQAVIGLGKNLGRHIIAKGIESQQQLAYLQHSDCSAAQGYLFKHPLTAEPFAQLLGLVEVPQVASN